MINENINIKNSEKKDEYIVIKELLTNREKIYQYQLSGIQNGIVNFCQNYNMFQGKSTNELTKNSAQVLETPSTED